MKLPMLVANIPFYITYKILYSCTYFEGAVTLNVRTFKIRVLLGPYSNIIQIMNVYECNGTNIFMR